VSASDDEPLRPCMKEMGSPIKMLAFLEERYASKRIVSREALLASLYKKRFNKNDQMNKHIDEFNSLLSQLESMGDNYKIPDSHKPILLMTSIGNDCGPANVLAALRMRDAENLAWDGVCSDLVQEWETVKKQI